MRAKTECAASAQQDGRRTMGALRATSVLLGLRGRLASARSALTALSQMAITSRVSHVRLGMLEQEGCASSVIKAQSPTLTQSLASLVRKAGSAPLGSHVCSAMALGTIQRTAPRVCLAVTAECQQQRIRLASCVQRVKLAQMESVSNVSLECSLQRRHWSRQQGRPVQLSHQRRMNQRLPRLPTGV